MLRDSRHLYSVQSPCHTTGSPASVDCDSLRPSTDRHQAPSALTMPVPCAQWAPVPAPAGLEAVGGYVPAADYQALPVAVLPSATAYYQQQRRLHVRPVPSVSSAFPASSASSNFPSTPIASHTAVPPTPAPPTSHRHRPVHHYRQRRCLETGVNTTEWQSVLPSNSVVRAKEPLSCSNVTAADFSIHSTVVNTDAVRVVFSATSSARVDVASYPVQPSAAPRVAPALHVGAASSSVPNGVRSTVVVGCDSVVVASRAHPGSFTVSTSSSRDRKRRRNSAVPGSLVGDKVFHTEYPAEHRVLVECSDSVSVSSDSGAAANGGGFHTNKVLHSHNHHHQQQADQSALFSSHSSSSAAVLDLSVGSRRRTISSAVQASQKTRPSSVTPRLVSPSTPPSRQPRCESLPPLILPDDELYCHFLPGAPFHASLQQQTRARTSPLSMDQSMPAGTAVPASAARTACDCTSSFSSVSSSAPGRNSHSICSPAVASIPKTSCASDKDVRTGLVQSSVGCSEYGVLCNGKRRRADQPDWEGTVSVKSPRRHEAASRSSESEDTLQELLLQELKRVESGSPHDLARLFPNMSAATHASTSVPITNPTSTESIRVPKTLPAPSLPQSTHIPAPLHNPTPSHSKYLPNPSHPTHVPHGVPVPNSLQSTHVSDAAPVPCPSQSSHVPNALDGPNPPQSSHISNAVPLPIPPRSTHAPNALPVHNPSRSSHVPNGVLVPNSSQPTHFDNAVPVSIFSKSLQVPNTVSTPTSSLSNGVDFAPNAHTGCYLTFDQQLMLKSQMMAYLQQISQSARSSRQSVEEGRHQYASAGEPPPAVSRTTERELPHGATETPGGRPPPATSETPGGRPSHAVSRTPERVLPHGATETPGGRPPPAASENHEGKSPLPNTETRREEHIPDAPETPEGKPMPAIVHGIAGEQPPTVPEADTPSNMSSVSAVWSHPALSSSSYSPRLSTVPALGSCSSSSYVPAPPNSSADLSLEHRFVDSGVCGEVSGSVSPSSRARPSDSSDGSPSSELQQLDWSSMCTSLAEASTSELARSRHILHVASPLSPTATYRAESTAAGVSEQTLGRKTEKITLEKSPVLILGNRPVETAIKIEKCEEEKILSSAADNCVVEKTDEVERLDKLLDGNVGEKFVKIEQNADDTLSHVAEVSSPLSEEAEGGTVSAAAIEHVDRKPLRRRYRRSGLVLLQQDARATLRRPLLSAASRTQQRLRARDSEPPARAKSRRTRSSGRGVVKKKVGGKEQVSVSEEYSAVSSPLSLPSMLTAVCCDKHAPSNDNILRHYSTDYSSVLRRVGTVTQGQTAVSRWHRPSLHSSHTRCSTGSSTLLRWKVSRCRVPPELVAGSSADRSPPRQYQRTVSRSERCWSLEACSGADTCRECKRAASCSPLHSICDRILQVGERGAESPAMLTSGQQRFVLSSLWPAQDTSSSSPGQQSMHAHCRLAVIERLVLQSVRHSLESRGGSSTAKSGCLQRENARPLVRALVSRYSQLRTLPSPIPVAPSSSGLADTSSGTSFCSELLSSPESSPEQLLQLPFRPGSLRRYSRLSREGEVEQTPPSSSPPPSPLTDRALLTAVFGSYVSSPGRIAAISSDSAVNTPTRSQRATRVRRRRCRFKSGLDYIIKRKRKRLPPAATSTDDPPSSSSTVSRRFPAERAIQGSPSSDLSAEIRSWMLNRSAGETTLQRAAKLGHPEAVLFLLESGEAACCCDHAGFSPLHEACARGHVTVARLLLLYGADCNASASGGVRPLHEAVEQGCVEMVRLLLSYGADPCVPTYSGLSPVELSVEAGSVQVSELLRAHLSDIDPRVQRVHPWILPAASFMEERGCHLRVLDTGCVEASPSPAVSSPLIFDVSSQTLPPLFCLRDSDGVSCSGVRYVALASLARYVGVASGTELLRQRPELTPLLCDLDPQRVVCLDVGAWSEPSVPHGLSWLRVNRDVEALMTWERFSMTP